MTNGNNKTDSESKKKTSKCSLFTKVIFIVLLLAIVITVVNQLSQLIDKNKSINRKTFIELPDRKALPSVTLEQAGKGQVSTESLKGKWHLLFFGYTFCPDVCPVELSTLRKMMDLLREDIPAKQLPQVVFISVDPERESPEKIKEYVTHFDPEFIGMTGEETDLRILSMPFGISWMKEKNTHPMAKADDKNYLLSHSTTLVLLNPEAKISGLFPAPHSAHEMAKVYEAVVQKEGY